MVKIFAMFSVVVLLLHILFNLSGGKAFGANTDQRLKHKR